MKTRPARRWTLLLIGLPLLAVLGSAIWLSTHQSNQTIRPATVSPAVLATTTQVLQQNVPIYLSGVGTVTAKESVVVKARTDGQLDNVDFQEGQDVKAGQLLAQLDPRTLQALLAQAIAQKAKDQAQLTNARLDLRRYALLIKQDAATRQTLDAQQALVAQLQAAVQVDEAQINYATTQLSFTRITAPISGRTGARLVDPGNIVHASDPGGLVVINQIDPIAVVFTLPEEAFQAINQALHSNANPLSVLAYPPDSDVPLGQGSLILLNNQIDTSTGTIQLKGSFPNSQHKLWPGQYVNARLILGQREQALTIPAAAVQRGPNGTYTYTVGADDTVQLQLIHVVNIQDGIAIIDKGLSAGQRVVVDGQYKLKPGLRIQEVVAPSSAKGPATGSVK